MTARASNAEPGRWAVALAGAVALAVAMGIGRFAFTPLLLCAVQRLAGSRSTAALTLLLFTLSGGVGA